MCVYVLMNHMTVSQISKHLVVYLLRNQDSHICNWKRVVKPGVLAVMQQDRVIHRLHPEHLSFLITTAYRGCSSSPRVKGLVQTHVLHSVVTSLGFPYSRSFPQLLLGFLDHSIWKSTSQCWKKYINLNLFLRGQATLVLQYLSFWPAHPSTTSQEQHMVPPCASAGSLRYLLHFFIKVFLSN